MKVVRLALIASVASIVLSLAGCETKPTDIAKWKAEGNTAKLAKALSDSRQFIRLDAIDALADLKAPDGVQPLGALLQDPDTVIVHKAINALATIGTPSIEPYMLQAIAFETDPARLTAAKMLGELKSNKGVEPLIATLKDEFDNIAISAAFSLGQIGNEKAIPPLTTTMLKGSTRLRSTSAESIRKIGGDSALQALASALGDLSLTVRNEGVRGLIAVGAPAEPVALKLLRSENNYERESALSILEGIKKVPTTGKDAVWYKLASLSVGENPPIQRLEGRKLAEIENGLDALIEAVAHPTHSIREHAFQGLETVGQPAVEPLLAAVASAKPEAAKWFNGRSDWAGAPAWQIDLWGAATALNPAFQLDKRGEKLLTSTGTSTEEMLRSKNFKPTRELIPLLIGQTKTFESDDLKEASKADRRRDLAFRKLRAYKQRSKFPLMAAAYDEDIQISAHATKILIGFDDDPRTKEVIVDSFRKHFESGSSISATPLHDAMLEMDTPEVDAMLLKIRPNAGEAIRTVEKKFPDTQVSNIEMPPTDLSIQAEPFRLKYLVNGRARELKVIFRPNADGDWVPTPPLPDELP